MKSYNAEASASDVKEKDASVFESKGKVFLPVVPDCEWQKLMMQKKQNKKNASYRKVQRAVAAEVENGREAQKDDEDVVKTTMSSIPDTVKETRKEDEIVEEINVNDTPSSFLDMLLHNFSEGLKQDMDKRNATVRAGLGRGRRQTQYNVVRKRSSGHNV